MILISNDMCTVSLHLGIATKGQRLRVYGKLIVVECPPFCGQQGIPRNPNANAVQRAAFKMTSFRKPNRTICCARHAYRRA